MAKVFSCWFTFIVIAFFLAACSFTPLEQQTATHVVKSDSDSREYRYLELPNQLKVLLVSDSNTERSAAALDVNVGSRQDPKNYQGLAHFLEHMLFLGTEKYPEAGEYQAFISAHGGSHNAYTSFDRTNYFFDISPDDFEPALDRFAQFFIAPLFTEEYVEREKNAVHSEYKAKIKDERRKSADVFKSVINQQHPFAKLSVGNLETLANGDDKAGQGSLREQLLDFYDQNYSASIMTLVLVGRESLDELEAIARQKFSSIRNNDKTVAPIEQPLFDQGVLPLTVQIKPEKSLRMLSIVFPTADDLSFYRQKPLGYLGNILGHEGRGSLLSYLKLQGWAEGLSAGLGLSYPGGATFNISISLTEAGVEHSDEIVTAVFQTINRIKLSTDRARLFDEQAAIAQQQFRYQEKSPAMGYASGLAASLRQYPPEDILRGGSLMSDYDEALVDRYLADLNPGNSIVTLTAPTVPVDQKTYFYSTDFSVSTTPQKQLDHWLAAGLNPAIQLPEANLFIADDLSLVDVSSGEKIPQQIIDQQGLRLWFKQTDKFSVPRGSLFFSVRSPVASDSVEHQAKLQLLTAVLADELNELSYPASLAGLNYSLSPHMRGFSVKINGFNDKQDLLLTKILAGLASPAFDSDRFENIKSEHIRNLENTVKQQPYHLLMDEIPDLLYKNSWSNQALLSVYRALTLDEIKAYRSSLLAAGQIDILVYGNYLQQDAEDFARQIAKTLLKKMAAPQAIEITKLAETVWSREVASDYTDASYALYIQAVDTDKKRRAALGVTAQMLRADFYTSLRTEKQLGYIVSSGAYPVMDVPGLFFLVQSPVVGPAQLEQEVAQFLQQRFEQLGSITEDEFEQQRSAVLSRLSEEPQNLWEQSGRYWKNLSEGYYLFDFRQQLITAMKSLTFAQWRQFFVQDVIENNRRIHVYTNGQFSKQGAVTGQPVTDVQVFKSAQPSYQFP